MEFLTPGRQAPTRKQSIGNAAEFRREGAEQRCRDAAALINRVRRWPMREGQQAIATWFRWKPGVGSKTPASGGQHWQAAMGQSV